ncbi:MAG: ATP-grasp domain-containing protein [Deltaproteobacteria bacterium]|nr:ATP-grasp domain-containing protein [Deltaproteobacteria bacterium]
MTAFSRILPAFFLNFYRIVALHRTEDLSLLRQKADIFCLEEETENGAPIPLENSESLLLHPQTGCFLDGIPGTKYFLLYQDYPGLRSAAQANGWHLLANSPQLRQSVATRKFFKKMVVDLNLPQAPGDIYPIETLHLKGYGAWCNFLGSSFVVQLPEIERGGGRGTFFVHSKGDYQQLQDRLAENRWRNTKLESISVHKFLEGIPSSVVVCVTRHGTLVSSLQRQLIDLPYCEDFAENGVFCGHAWGVSAGSEASREFVFKQACRIGDYLGALGYRGVLGIDFIVHEKVEKVYPIEINPRLTGALPMLSLLHLQAGVIPLEAFHMLEFLDIPYRIDRNALNKRYAETVKGSHLLLFRPPASKTRGVIVRPGLYEYGPSKEGFHFLKEALAYQDIGKENQFILIDGPMYKKAGEVIRQDSLDRLCRLLFSYPVVDHNGMLSPQALLAANWVREETAKGGNA